MEPDCVFNYQFRSAMLMCKDTILCQQTKSLHIKSSSVCLQAPNPNSQNYESQKIVLLLLMIQLTLLTCYQQKTKLCEFDISQYLASDQHDILTISLEICNKRGCQTSFALFNVFCQLFLQIKDNNWEVERATF